MAKRRASFWVNRVNVEGHVPREHRAMYIHGAILKTEEIIARVKKQKRTQKSTADILTGENGPSVPKLAGAGHGNASEHAAIPLLLPMVCRVLKAA